MRGHLRVFLGAGALALSACAGSEDEVEGDALPIAGMYEVTGETVTKATGDKRAISGKIIIVEEEGGAYTATFTLMTTYPGAEEALPAEVIGKGEGQIRGRILDGTAETQLVMATVPGVDPGFAFVPRMVSTRLVSRSSATVAADGTVQIEIDNQAAPGEEGYVPTRTTLSGVRVSSAEAIRGLASGTASRE